MKIVHTSDWHAGKVWKGIRRLDELAATLDHLGGWIEREQADLLLVSGDVFDTATPSADAEDLVFRFLRRMGDAQVPSVVIAGNHDNPGRFLAWGRFATLAGVHVVARPLRAEAGGVLRITSRSGETAVVAALPFASMRDLVAAAQLAASDTEAHQAYTDGVRAMVAHLCAGFGRDTVNILLAHLHLQNAVLGGSERKVHVGDQWAATPQALPPAAHYIALGHIHRPQAVEAPSPAVYAGSPLQLDFGEEGDAKSFVVIEATPGRPARIQRVPYVGGRPLRTVTAGLPELEARAAELRDAGWLRVRVQVPVRDAELAVRVRKLLPNAVVVEAELPPAEATETAAPRPDADAPPRELFRAYHRAAHGSEPHAALLAGFDELLGDGGEDAPP